MYVVLGLNQTNYRSISVGVRLRPQLGTQHKNLAQHAVCHVFDHEALRILPHNKNDIFVRCLKALHVAVLTSTML